ncbi:MAG: GH39 family glycosyl hydrolase [Streptosporangiaceae bacterium]
MTGDRKTRAAAEAARGDWERRIYRRSTDTAGADPARALPAPARLTATPGAGHVRLDWQPVPGAAGYLIERTGPDGKPQIVTHGGSDVPAVPGPPFADTGLDEGVGYRYRVGAVTAAEHPVWAWSEPIGGSPAGGEPGGVTVTVDAAADRGRPDRVWQMVGSERLSQLRLDGSAAERVIASEFADALAAARSDLGVTTVRAHAILHDDNAVVRVDAGGALSFDFSRVDAIYDQLLATGLRPVVELSFMPAALARDPGQTVFGYRGIISPPADWARWRSLVGALARHLVDRYGIDEVATWAFEVWNEPNLAVFWTGTRQEYLRLYDEAAGAIKSVDGRLRVGGPATAAAEWIDSLAAHAAADGVPLDFVSTHTYGNLPLDLRPTLARHGLAKVPVWWTEWGVGATHNGPVHDGPLGAPFILTGLRAAQGRLDALAYWVISDHFEELGRPDRLFHNGFGLLTVGNLRKPRYWALHLAAHLGDHLLGCELAGDGADTLVQAWAARHDDGTVDVLIWNGTINTALMDGDQRLDRRISLAVTGLPAIAYRVSLARIDHQHSNIVRHCPPEVSWPDEAGWARLRAADALHEERLPDVTPDAGTARFHLELPMPGVARVRMSAGSPPPGTR